MTPAAGRLPGGLTHYHRILAPRAKRVLSPGTPVVVAPELPHEVVPLGKVRFYVESHAAHPEGGSPHAGGGPIA
ncbi:MAG: hypothetical protein AB7M05_05165 [Alphaproteobacteria bacterium]